MTYFYISYSVLHKFDQTRINDGGNSSEATPVPIPNTAVKLTNVDGTAWETVWESRTPPSLILF